MMNRLRKNFVCVGIIEKIKETSEETDKGKKYGTIPFYCNITNNGRIIGNKSIFMNIWFMISLNIEKRHFLRG